jgi:hypothetical protein
MAAWFDPHPSAYWIPAWVAFALLVVAGSGPLVAGLAVSIATHDTAVADVNGSRIYVRNDRLGKP